MALGEVTDTILFGVFQSISGYGGHYPCRIQSVKRDYRKIDNGMIYQKNWPFTRLFNFHLFKMHERGVLGQIQNKHLETFNVVISPISLIPSVLYNHIQNKHLETRFDCEICHKSLKSRKSLHAHVTSVHHKDKLVHCEYCDKGFATSTSLQRHIGIQLTIFLVN